MVRNTLVFPFFCILSCAYGVAPSEPQETLVSMPGATIDTETDFMNCGVPRYACDPSEADSCVGGSCQCGDTPECGDGEDCRYGRCIPADPAGAGCEFDDECGDGYGCLCLGEGRDCDRHCTDLGCVAEQGVLACDRIDNDCDHCVDGTVDAGGFCVPVVAAEHDIVFFVDISGSMAREIGSVVRALSVIAKRLSGSEYRFAIVLVPSYEVDGRPAVYSDFVDFSTFRELISGLVSALQGDEPMYDAVYEVATGELPLSWRDGSNRILIGFTDEEGQSFREDFGLSPVGEGTMCAALTHGETAVFVAQNIYSGDFNACGTVFSIDQPAENIANGLDIQIQDPCS